MYDKGLEIAAALSEECNGEYVAYFSAYGELTEIAEELAAQDYSQPKSVYEVKYSEDGFKQLLESAMGTGDELPEAILKRVAGFSYLANMVNARKGTNYIALSSILTAEELFVNETVTEDTAYLYFYEDAYPVLVSYHAGEDGAIHAVGNYIFNDELKEQGMDALNEMLGEEFFAMFPDVIEVTQIK